VDKTTTGKGHTYRIIAQYKGTPDRMVYATLSTGYRPGGLNRRGSLPPYKPDYLKNYEFGWKTMWLDNRLAWNGAVFRQDWDDFQFSYLGANGLTEIRNAGKAKMKGIETDFSWLPVEGLTLNGSASYIDAKLAEDYIPDPDNPPDAFDGDRLPVTAKFKGNLVARYDWTVNDFDAHVQGAVVYTGSGYPDLTRFDRSITGKTPSYTTIDLSAGVKKTSWRAELYVKNLFDEHGQYSRFVGCNASHCTHVYTYPIRPRTIGVRFGQDF
jgi:outer membrane receptor protein involved in Fe transport